MSEPAGPWALILGASTGSGAAIASALARSPGLHIYGAHRGNWPEGAASVGQQVEALGRRCRWWRADASEGAAIEQGAALLREELGPQSIAVFVHSIASASVGSLGRGPDRLHPRQLERTFARMAHSFVGWTQALLDQELLAPESLLLGLTNPWTGHVVRNTAAIAASKAALEVYVRHLAVELGPLGHRVNLLRYGFVPTEATRRTFPGEAYEALQRSLSEVLPAGRVCTVEEVGQLVAFLASPPGRWFNGATIDYTGAEGFNAMDRLIYGARKESP